MIPKGKRVYPTPVRHKKKRFVFKSQRKGMSAAYIDTKLAFLESCLAAEPNILKEYEMEE
jgi:hypothetical protein